LLFRLNELPLIYQKTITMAKHPNLTEELNVLGLAVGAKFSIHYNYEIDDIFKYGTVEKITDNFVFYTRPCSPEHEREGHRNALNLMKSKKWTINN